MELFTRTGHPRFREQMEVFMTKFKSGVIAVALIGMFGATVDAELSLARQRVFTAEDAYAQMGGLPLEPSLSASNTSTPKRLVAHS